MVRSTSSSRVASDFRFFAIAQIGLLWYEENKKNLEFYGREILMCQKLLWIRRRKRRDGEREGVSVWMMCWLRRREGERLHL